MYRLTSLRNLAVTGAVTFATGASLLACSSGDNSTVASGCVPKHDKISTISQGTLTVGVIDQPPFASYNSGDPDGIDIKIIKTIAADECLDLAWQPTTYADAAPSISTGALDMAIGTIDATEKRLQVVDFSSSTYLDGMGLVAKSPGVNTIADLEKVSGKVGTVDGYMWTGDLQQILGDKLQTYPSSVELKADYDAGRLAVAVDGYGTAIVVDPKSDTIVLANKSPDERVQSIAHSPEAAFPLTKGNESLKAALSDGIDEQRDHGVIDGLLSDAGVDESLAKVGQTQYVVPMS